MALCNEQGHRRNLLDVGPGSLPVSFPSVQGSFGVGLQVDGEDGEGAHHISSDVVPTLDSRTG